MYNINCAEKRRVHGKSILISKHKYTKKQQGRPSSSPVAVAGVNPWILVCGDRTVTEYCVLGFQLFLAGSWPKTVTKATPLWARLAWRLQLQFWSQEICVGRIRDSTGQNQKYVKIFGRMTDNSSSFTASQELDFNLKLCWEPWIHRMVWDGREPKAHLVPPPATGKDTFH